MTHYAHPNVLVDTKWLVEHLNDPDTRIIEVDMSPEPYKDAHIPGAVFWNVFTDLLRADLSINLDKMAVEKLLSRSGIVPETTVIAYGSSPGTGAWIFWLLKLFGHQDVRVLNGEHRQWLTERCPVVSEFSTFAPTQYSAKPLDPNLRVLHEDVQSAIEHPEQVILDVRTLEEYQGKQFLMKPPEGTERAGHIPGAVHVEHLLTLNMDGTFKSFDELQRLYRNKGVTPDKDVFPYCAIGARSAYTWFVLRYLLGYPRVRNYDGSWNQWSRLPNAPIEQSSEATACPP